MNISFNIFLLYHQPHRKIPRNDENRHLPFCHWYFLSGDNNRISRNSFKSLLFSFPKMYSFPTYFNISFLLRKQYGLTEEHSTWSQKTYIRLTDMVKSFNVLGSQFSSLQHNIKLFCSNLQIMVKFTYIIKTE